MSFGDDSDSGGWGGIDADRDSGGFGGGGFGGDSGGGGDLGGDFASSFGGGPLGDFSFGGWGDPGAGANFGDVGFGTGGAGYAGQGFLESNIAGISGLSGDVANAIRALPAAEQQNIYSTVIGPALETHYGWQGDIASGLTKSAMGLALSAFAPGLGTLANITGVTGYFADRFAKDMPFSQTVGEKLGVRSSSPVGFDREPGGEDVIQRAIDAGKTPQEILSAINETIRAQGGDMSTWDEIWGGITGSTAAGAATGAAQTQAGYQQQALDYLKSREAMPLQIAGGAMERLGGLYGLHGGAGNQQQFIEQAKASPMYGAIMGGQQAGEEAIMRQAGMTGGLRSGNVQENLYDYNVQLQNQSLQSAYGQQLGGLQQLAGMQPGGAGAIAGTMAGIGGTLAGGQTAAAQAQQAGTANLMGMAGTVYEKAGGLGGILGGLTSAGKAYSTAGGGLSGVGSSVMDLGKTVASWF